VLVIAAPIHHNITTPTSKLTKVLPTSTFDVFSAQMPVNQVCGKLLAIMLGGFTRSLSALVHFTLHTGAGVDSVVYI
jgi:hypothetical protein